MRILVDQGGNEEGAEELTGHVLAEGHAGILGKSAKSGSVSGIGVALQR